MSLSFTELSSIATNAIDKKLNDGVFNSNPVLKRLSDKSKKMDGGLKIQVPIIYQANASGGAYSDLDPLTVTRTDDITAAVYDWKQVYQSVRISQLDLLKTSGDAGKLDLIASKIKIAEMSIRDTMGTGVFSDGTGSSNKQITGFQAMIAASGTYGGIAPADYAGWVATVKANGAVARPVTLGLIQSVFGACSQDSEQPTLMVSKQNVYDEVYNLFTPHQRLESEDMAKLGFKSLMVNGIPFVVDSHMKAGSIFFINENHAQLAVHKDNNFRKQHHASLETTDSMLTKIFWAGNLTCSNRRFQGELGDIKVAA